MYDRFNDIDRVLLKLDDMRDASSQEIIAYTAEEAARLTGSRFGVVGLMSHDDKKLTLYGSMDCRGIIPARPHALNIHDGGIWAEPVLQRRPVIVNDASAGKGSPAMRFIGVPVFDGMNIVAVVEACDRDAGYDASDESRLFKLACCFWRLLLLRRYSDMLSASPADEGAYVEQAISEAINKEQIAMGFLELSLDKLETKGHLGREDAELLQKPMDALISEKQLIQAVQKLLRLKHGLL
ncbi:GAF domain-containing protein [Methanocella conradii]|uniref:GAF domain-containing protein n=1 Tax=Methanocella conradii TaxID=1175444 RepID=UPI0024B32F8C|nr:GAF domain-containing protein [Methanocella conradii]MDI6897943.1 GAF domain-containing protein [Methanocella conradii]